VSGVVDFGAEDCDVFHTEKQKDSKPRQHVIRTTNTGARAHRLGTPKRQELKMVRNAQNFCTTHNSAFFRP